ncbi:hypothetical protein L596_012171 [Steinernema carpocapsae]|uniref:Uncharacterized protein n=1 Tax=Steinernema carpocapsae TaxID=34508 RepID=A0A4U5NX51_STECR|nr:hypothetical protein L596_012171 [Steinernema carpocapsae]
MDAFVVKLFVFLVLLGSASCKSIYLSPEYRDEIGEDYTDKLTGNNGDWKSSPCFNHRCPLGAQCFAMPDLKCHSDDCPLVAACVDIG